MWCLSQCDRMMIILISNNPVFEKNWALFRSHNLVTDIFLLCRNHALQKTKKGYRYRIAIVPRRSPPRRGSPRGAWLWIWYFGSVRKIPPLMGGKGACPPGLPPPPGERGGHSRNFHASSKKPGRDFLQSLFFIFYVWNSCLF